MTEWHEVMMQLASEQPGLVFSFTFPRDLKGYIYEDGPVIIDVTFDDGSKGTIYQTVGGDWTFGGWQYEKK